MKKTLIALAALAAVGAASAQSSVTILGVVDAGIARQTGDATFTSWRNRVNINNTATTALKFTGVEDLGGGLRALFMAEINWNPAQSNASLAAANSPAGTPAYYTGTPFNGEQYLGLAGGFGSIKLGTPNAAALEVNGMMQPFGTALGGGYSGAFGRLDPFSGLGANQSPAVGGGRIIRHERTVRYDTPVIAGFTGSYELSFGNDNAANVAGGTGNANNNDRYNALGLKYAAGPLNLGYAHSRISIGNNQPIGVAATLAAASVKFNQLAANYNFGFFTLMGGYTSTSSSAPLLAAGTFAAKSRSWNVGAKMPVGAFDLSANYVRVKDRSANTYVDETPTVLGLGVDYNLSKRTALYTRYERISASGGTTAAAALPGAFVARRTNTLALGVRHAF